MSDAGLLRAEVGKLVAISVKDLNIAVFGVQHGNSAVTARCDITNNVEVTVAAARLAPTVDLLSDHVVDAHPIVAGIANYQSPVRQDGYTSRLVPMLAIAHQP